MAMTINLIIDKGADFEINFSLEWSNGVVFNTNGYSSNACIRKQYSSNSYIVFNSDISNNNLNLSVSANQTSNVDAGRYVYDVKISNGNTVLRIVEGTVDITPQVTK